MENFFVMATLQISDSQLSLLNALWTLFKSLPKAVRSAFIRRIIDEGTPVVSDSVRRAKVVKRGLMPSDAELEKLLGSNNPIGHVDEADVKGIVAGESGKSHKKLNHWM